MLQLHVLYTVDRGKESKIEGKNYMERGIKFTVKEFSPIC